jgi:hypothetical protein
MRRGGIRGHGAGPPRRVRDDQSRRADKLFGSRGEIGQHEPLALRRGRAGALECSPGPKQSGIKEDMMRAAARTSSVRGIPENRTGHWWGRTIFAAVLAEFRRAAAAARRYEDLRYGSGRPERMPRGEIPRRVSRNSIRRHGPGRRAAPSGTSKSTGTDPMRARLIGTKGSTHDARRAGRLRPSVIAARAALTRSGRRAIGHGPIGSRPKAVRNVGRACFRYARRAAERRNFARAATSTWA